MPNFLFEGLLGPLFIAALLLAALLKILKITEKMSGEFGSMAAEYAGKVVGVAGTAALGAATGGTALALRGGMGALATKVASSGAMEGLATSNSKVGQWVGRQGMTLTDKAKTGTWDIRETGLAKSTLGAGMKAVGMDMGKASKNAKGGYEGAQKRQRDDDIKFAKRLEATDAQKRKRAGETEGYGEAIIAREKNKKKELVAKKQLQEAKEEEKRSPTGQAVASMNKNLGEKQKGAEDAKNKLEEIKNNPAGLLAPDGRKIGEAEAEDKLRKAEKDVQTAQQLFNEAVSKHQTSAEAKTIAEATKELEAVAGALKTAEETIKKSDADAEEWATQETDNRRESFAQQVESRRSWKPSSVGYGSNSRQARETTAKKIRDKEQPKKKDEEKTIGDLLKEIAEKKESDSKKGEEKKEEKH